MSSALAFTIGHRTDRVVALGVLALRALRHVAIGRAPAGPPIEGLRVAAASMERPGWHEATGLYGFLHLPPGPRRVLVTDPGGLYQPAAFDVIVPDRGALRRQLEAGAAAPNMTPRALVREVELHAAPAATLPPGITAVFGQVRDAAGRPVALARLMLTAFVDGAMRQHLTWTTQDGTYSLRLPGERPDTIGGDPPWGAARALVVHAPRAPLAASLARDFLANLPAERDTLDPNATFEQRSFALRDAAGAARSGPPGFDPTLPIDGGQHTRWDIELA